MTPPPPPISATGGGMASPLHLLPLILMPEQLWALSTCPLLLETLNGGSLSCVLSNGGHFCHNGGVFFPLL